ncbi:MAG: hypothetical protein EXS05_22175 [Planctomycetaceae bacterium]|nr:hypothetical protein [Planctomycetaceae bacterium]
MPTSNASRKPAANRPEKKIGPYPGGIGVAVWINTIQTDNGPRKVRSITLSPRRYRDAKTGEWKDSSSYQTGDIPALIYALQKALDHDYSNPLPGADSEQSGDHF